MALGELLNSSSAVSTEKFFLVTTPKITSLTKAISSNLLVYLTPAFTIGAIYEFCKGGRFFDLLLKLVLCCAFISSGKEILEFGCNEGFKLSDQIASWASNGDVDGNWLPRFILNSSAKKELTSLQNNELKKLKVFSKKAPISSVSYVVSKSMKTTGVGYGPLDMDVETNDRDQMENISSLEKNGIPDFGVTDTLMIGILLGACLIVKLVFTAGYYLTLSLMIVPCLLLFIPVLEASFSGLLKSMAFCFLLPVVFTILLFLLGEMVQDNFFDPRFVSIEKTVMLIVMSIIVVMSIAITWTILSSTGIGGALSAAGAMMGSQLTRQTVGNFASGASGAFKNAFSTGASALVKNPLVMEALASSLGSFARNRPNSLMGALAQRGANSAQMELKNYSPLPYSPRIPLTSLGIDQLESKKNQSNSSSKEIPSNLSTNKKDSNPLEKPQSAPQNEKTNDLSQSNKKIDSVLSSSFEAPTKNPSPISQNSSSPKKTNEDSFKTNIEKSPKKSVKQIKSTNDKLIRRPSKR